MGDRFNPRSEGMVAIVRGIDDAGLTVTVRARTLEPRTETDPAHRRGSLRSQPHMATSAVQTSQSQTSPLVRSRSTTAVTRDDAYVSTYQKAYGSRGCSPVQSSLQASPARRSTTFDIQKLNDQLNELRANVYGPNVNNTRPSYAAPAPSTVQSPSAYRQNRQQTTEPSQTFRSSPVRDVPHRLNLANFSRGCSSSIGRDSRISDAFVESLRKYPSADRTASADIIQRLLACTQSKNRAKKITGMKRVHSSHESTAKCSKHIQTYTRTRKESSIHDTGVSRSRKPAVSPVKSHSGTKVDQDDALHDCFKIGSFGRTSEVRYLQDVNRYVRDTLRLACNNTEVACPQILDRYLAHRREHHMTEAGTVTTPEVEKVVQTSGLKPKRSKQGCRFSDLPFTSNCRVQPRTMSDTIRMKMTEIKEKLCDICNQSAPCVCDTVPCVCSENQPITLADRVKAFNICDEIHRFCTQETNFQSCSCPQDVDELIENAVNDWIQGIPIYANYTLKEKETRDRAVNELKVNLKKHVSVKDKCRDDAINCLKYLPMWLPSDKTDQDSFKEKLADELVELTTGIDVFKERVRKWVDSLPFLSGVKINKDKLVKYLESKLKDTAMTSTDLKNDLKNEAYAILDEMPIKVCTCLETEQLAERLAQSLVSLDPELIDGLKNNNEFSYIRKELEFMEKIKTWVNQIPFKPSAKVNRDTVTQEFVDELNSILKRTDPEMLWETVKGYVQQKLYNKPMLGGFAEVAYQATNLADDLTSDMFAEVVCNWAKDIAFDHDSNTIPEIFAYDLTNKLRCAIENLELDEVENTLNNCIFDALNHVPASGSVPLKHSQADKLAKALSKLGRKNAGRIKLTIKKWLKGVPFLPSEPPVDQEKVVKSLAELVHKIIKNTEPSEMWSEIKKMAEGEMNELPIANSPVNVGPLAIKLADNLLDVLFEDAVFGWARSIPLKTGEIDVDQFATDLCKKLKDAVVYENSELFAKHVKELANEKLHDDMLFCDSEEKAKYIDDLVDTLLNTPNKRDHIAVIVNNWYKNVPTLTPVTREKAKDFLNKVKFKLTKTNNRDKWTAMKQVAIDELEHTNTSCLSTEIEVLSEKLANMLAPEEFEEIIKDWSETIPLDNRTNESVDTFRKRITMKIKDTIAEGDLEDVHENLRNTIVDELNEQATTLEELKKTAEAERLITDLKKIYPDRDGILKTIENWLKTVPFKPLSDQLVNQKIKVTKDLANTFHNKIKTIEYPEDAWLALSEVTEDRLKKLPIDTANTTIERLGIRLVDMIVVHLISEAIRNAFKKYDNDNLYTVNKELIKNLIKKIDNIVIPKSQEKYEEVLKDVTAAILPQELPMCSLAQMNDIGNEMAKNISGLPRKPDHFTMTVHSWAKALPFASRPQLQVDKHKFATVLCNELMKVVEFSPRSEIGGALFDKTIDSLKNYDLKCSDGEKSKLAEKLVSQLVDSLYIDTVSDWLKSLLANSNSNQLVDKEELCNKLTEIIKPLLFKDSPGTSAANFVKLVNDDLVPLGIEIDPFDVEHDLIERLLKLPKAPKAKPLKFAVNINQWLKGVTVTLGPEETKALVEKTLGKIRKMRSQKIDEAKIRKEIKQDITNHVDEVFKNQNTKPGAKSNLVEKLCNKVFNTFKSMEDDKKNEKKEDLTPKFQNCIKDWLTEHEELAYLELERDKISKELASQLVEDLLSGKDELDIKNKIHKVISDKLDSIDRSLEDKPKIKNKLLKSLFDKIAANRATFLTDQAGKDTPKRQFRVEAMYKVKSGISAVETVIQDQVLTSSLSDLNTQDKLILKRDSSINKSLNNAKNMNKNKSTVIDELLKDLETKSNFDIIGKHVRNTNTHTKIDRKNNILFDSISEISSNTLSGHNKFHQSFSEEMNQNKNNILKNIFGQDIKSEIISIIEKEIGNISDLKMNELYNQVNVLMDHLMETINQIQSAQLTKELLQEDSGSHITVKPKKQNSSSQIKKHSNTFPEYQCKYEDKNLDTKSLKIEINSIESGIHTEVSTSTVSTSIVSDKEPERSLVNAFKTDIRTLLESVPELSSNSSAEIRKNEKVYQGLTARLTGIDLQDLDKKQTRRTLQTEIVETLEEILETKGEQLHIKTKRMLANQLLDILSIYLRAVTYTSITTRLIDVNENRIKQTIRRWLEEIADLSGRLSSERNVIDRTAKALIKSIKKIKMKNFDSEETKKNLLFEIKQKLDAALKYQGRKINNKTKQKYADQLLKQLIDFTDLSNKCSVCTIVENKNNLVNLDSEENLEHESFKMNNWKENLNKNFEISDEETQKETMQNKTLHQLYEIILGKRKKRVEKRRSLSQLFMESLVDNTSCVDVLRNKPIPKDIKAWFQKVPELQAKNKKYLSDLSTSRGSYARLHLFNLIKQNLHKIMSFKIKHNVDSASKRRNINSKSKEKIVEELLESIENNDSPITFLTEIDISTQHTKETLKKLLPELFLDKPFNERELENLSKNITNLLYKFQTSDIENKAIRKHILTRIKNQLDMTFNNIDNYLSLKGTYKIAEKLLESVAKSEKKANVSKVFQKEVLSWLEDIPEIESTNTDEKKDNVKASFDLAKMLEDKFSSALDNKLMKIELLDEIRHYLIKVLEKRSVKMKMKDINKNVTKLVNNLTMLLAPVNKVTDIQDIIWEWVNEISMLSQEYMPEQRTKINELSNTLYTIHKKNISSNIKKDKMTKEINRWLKDISNRKDGLLDECNNNHKSKIMDVQSRNLYFNKDNVSYRHTYAKTRPGCSKDYGINLNSSRFKKSVGGFNTNPSEVFFQLKTGPSSHSVQEISREIDPNIQSKIISFISKNIDGMAVPTEAEKIRMQIKNILMSEAFLPENEANELTEAIMNSAQGQVAAVDDEITDILKRQIQTLLDDYAITGENRDEVGAYLLDRLFNPTDNDEDLLEVIKNKGGLSDKNARSMLKQLGAVSNMSMETFKSPSRTSTPKKRRSESDTLFPPGTSKKGKVPTYNDALNDKMMGWMDNLPKHLQPNLDKADVQKRLKGLSDKIEKLKGQPDADRKIRALLDKELPMIFEDLDEDEIKRLGSSLFNNLNKDGFTDDTWSPPGSSKSSKSGKVPTYNDALQDEMMGWMDNLPKHLQPNLDKADVQKRLKGLSDKIEKLKGQPDADRKIRALLDKELPMIFEDLDEDEIKRLGSSLLNNLKKEGFTDDTWSPPGSSKSSKSGKVPTYNDALQDEMMGWMDNLPKHLQPNLDKADVQKRLKGLSDKIEKLKGQPDADRKIRALLDKELPMIFEDLGEDEIKRLGSSLFNNLKKDGFTDGTLRLPNSKSDKIPTYNEALNDKMMGWMDNLPKHLQPNLDKADVQKRLKGLSDKIEKLKGQPDADRKIRALLDKELPMIFEDLDEDEIKRLGSSLFNNLKKDGFTDGTLRLPNSKSDKIPTYNEALNDKMMAWMDNLPKHLQPNLDKADVQKRLKGLSDKIEKLKGQPNADRKIRALLDKELPMIFEDLDEDKIKRLGSSLLNNLKKEGFTDDTWSPPGSSKSSKSGKVPTYNDALQDEMMGWMDNLPKHLQPNLDKADVQKRLKGLSDKIEKLKGQPDADRKIRALLDKELPMIFEDLGEDEIKRLGSSLFNNLKKDGFTDGTLRLPNSKSDKIPTYNEALNDKMMGWMDNLPKHLQPNLDKADVQKRLKGLSDKIEKLKGQPNADRKIRALLDKELPMIFEDLDEDEIKRLGSSLLNNLKKEGFTDDTWSPPGSSKSSKSGKVPTYNDALQDEMMGWMDNLPKHLQPNLDKADVQKRLKGLSDKIEKLKGQPDADRKIRALLDKELPMIFEDLDEDEIKRLGSSLLNNLKKEGFTDDTWSPPGSSKSSKSGKVPTYNDALQDEMMGWMDNLPKHLQPNLDKADVQKRLKGLSDKIEKLKGQPNADRKIRALLDKELPMIFEDLDEDEIKRLGSSLLNNLKKEGFTDDTWRPPNSKSDKIPTYNEALNDKMMGWMDNLPKHLQPNLDKGEAQKRLKGLSDKIEKLKGQPDADRKIRALLDKELPMIFEDLDEDEIKRLGCSLFNNLNKDGFTDDTWSPPGSSKSSKSGKVPTYNDALQDEMMGWMDNLPKHLQPNLDKGEVQKRLKGLSDKIEKLKGQPDADRKIRALLDKELPMIFEDLDEDEIKRLGSSLLNNLKKEGFTDDTWRPPNSKSDKIPTYNEALNDKMMGWMDNLPKHLQPNLDKADVQKRLKGLSDKIEKLKDQPDAGRKIRDLLDKELPLIFENLDPDEVKRLGSSLFNNLKKNGFTDNTWKPPTRQTSDIAEQNLISSVEEWLKQTPMYQKATSEEKSQMKSAAKDIAKGIKRAVSIAKLTPGTDMDDMVREQIIKGLKNVIVDPKLKTDEEFLNTTADNIINYLKTKKAYQDLTSNSTETLPNMLDAAVDNWTKKLAVDNKTPQQQEQYNKNKQNFVSRLKQARSQFHPSSPEHSIAIKDEGRKFLRLNLTDPNKKADEKYIEKYVNILETALQTIPIEHDDTIKNSIKPYKSPADTLYDYIEDWVQSLPVQGDPEKINLMKQNLASKLVNKIGELNINPDIFNDAALYQDLLQEEIDKLLDEIPKNPELNKYLPALKRDFISKIMDARQDMLKELGGKFYKQHLRDKISTSLPLPSCLTADEEASFEILKDKVADAFINLHYASCDQSENQRYKSQISHELNKFVHEIFYNHPCGKLDPEKLKNDLFKALSRVPIPRDDVMKSEIEQARIRELIYDWMQDLPLRQETVTEKLHRYKLASVLAKRLHDIEMEKQANDFIDSDYKISEEISRFLNKLLLIQGQESKIPGLVKKVMNFLKYTEQSRTFVSTSQRCQRDVPSTDICSRYPTTLSPEDQDHLNRIKIRRGKACNKDVGVCPLISTSSQTDYRGQNQVEKRTSPVKRVTSPKSCSAMPQTKDAACMTPRESPCHIQPKVFVKEFIWESLDSCEGIEQGVQTSQSLVEATAGPSGRLKKSIDQPGTYSSFARPLQEQKSPCTNSLCSRKSRYVEDEFSSEEESFPRPGFSRYDRTCRKGPKVLEDRSKRPCLRSRRMVSDRRFREDEVAHNPWSRYRMRREGFRLLDNDSNKCNCKDRIQVSCKGYRNRYIDMCQACGSTCPHPSPPFFK